MVLLLYVLHLLMLQTQQHIVIIITLSSVISLAHYRFALTHILYAVIVKYIEHMFLHIIDPIVHNMYIVLYNCAF